MSKDSRELLLPGLNVEAIDVHPSVSLQQHFCWFPTICSFSVICAKRHHESYSYSDGGDYVSGKYGPIFQTHPVTPVAIGKGNVQLNYFDDQVLDGINQVTFNKHQVGYKIGAVNGFM